VAVNGIKVLSLFDGIACGLVALKRAKINISEYHAYEIDYKAIQVTKNNHPEVIHHGSVENANFSKFKNIDLIIGGSPCQGFSFLGNQLGFNHPESKLYFEFERAIKEIKPKYFLLENTPMDWSYVLTINKRLNVNYVELNSVKVSAQHRKRLYWKNWEVPEPYDFKINLQDILIRDYKLIKNYKVNKTPSRDKMWLEGKCKNITYSNKSNCLTTRQDRWGNAGLIEFEDYCRYLTPIECERLQTLPDDYTKGFSPNERYKMLGNCWTINMISWLFWYSPFGNN
jgi:site-specific DNA-cytosine methylase